MRDHLVHPWAHLGFATNRIALQPLVDLGRWCAEVTERVLNNS
jgi:hypothetical protein